MRVLILSCVFPPEPVTSAGTSADLAAGLVQRGHDVRVVAPMPTRPGSRVMAGYSRWFPQSEKHADGYEIVRLPVPFLPRRSLVGRSLEYAAFGTFSSLAAFFNRADIIYANTWPVLGGLGLPLIRCLRGIPFVLSVQDVHPEAATLTSGISPRGPLANLLRRTDGYVARRAQAIATICPAFTNLYRDDRGVPPERLHTVPNWMDADRVKPTSRENRLRSALGIPAETRVAMFAGNIGSTANVDSILDAASSIAGRADVRFVIAGDGSERQRLEALAAQRQLENVQFIHPLRNEDFNDVQGLADVMLLPTCAGGASASVPSKMIAYMLAGRPIIAAVEEASETAAVIRRADCGSIVQPADPLALGQAVLTMLDRPREALQKGAAGRLYAVEHFGRQQCVSRLADILESAAGANAHPTALASAP
ncbi:glycosyltransferase family 4 protein [Candidatus Laterigemmans baculatus]|uniref:glycosyltransferase family 4 protein n=1 Tax=Candidatus Laterigemmans baculatus TaxID=2770505 RepID=UPI0021BCF7E6|nr:glycosyltransferase family 4 protein [Candidatus Laterigemmans baculatus]